MFFASVVFVALKVARIRAFVENPLYEFRV